MLKKSIFITERDMDILNFINEFGFCTIDHLCRRFELKTSRAYQIMQRLKGMKLIEHERVFYKGNGIFRVSKNIENAMEFPVIKSIPLGQYQHTLKLVDVFIKLNKKHPDALWVSERRMLNEKYVDGLHKLRHVLDGLLIMPDGKKIGIEVELTLKGKRRLEGILKGFASCFDLKEVWYYCDQQLIPLYSEMVSGLPFIKIHSIQEFLA